MFGSIVTVNSTDFIKNVSFDHAWLSQAVYGIIMKKGPEYISIFLHSFSEEKGKCEEGAHHEKGQVSGEPQSSEG